jgi:hypothetical protein
MATTEISDGTISLEIVGATAVSVTDPVLVEILTHVAALQRTLPMATYELERVNSDDRWTVTATAADTREYGTTVTLAGDEFLYSLTSFPESTGSEAEAFLELIQILTRTLKLHEITSIEITW